MANVLAFLSGSSRRDWSQQELAEFYRVERALTQAGMSVVTDRGRSDEGDPWFVFCRAEDGEVVVHFARIDGQYVVAGPAYEGTVSGVDIRSIATDLVGRHPLMQRRLPKDDNIILHPAALLVAIVAIALLKSSEAQAHSSSNAQPRAAEEIAEATGEKNASASELIHSSILDARHMAVVISAAMIATGLTADSQQGSPNDLASLASLPVDSDPSGETTSATSSFQLSYVSDVRERSDYGQNLGADVEQNDQPSLTAEQTIDLLSFVAVLNDVAVPAVVQESEASQAQTIAGFFGAAAARALADAESTIGPEQQMSSPPAIVELELEEGESLPAVRSLTFAGPDQVSHTAEFEIVSALPSNLQPYLASGLSLEAASSSASVVLTALNLDIVPSTVDSPSDPVEILTPISPPTLDVVAEPAQYSLGGVALDTIVNYIEDFAAHADRFKVLYSDGDIIFYDLADVTTNDRLSLHAITWEFADGTSVSLIGSRLDLPDDLAA